MTKPILLTVAMPGAEDNQGFKTAAVPLPASWLVPVPQMDKVPEMVGNELIVATAVTWQPLISV